MIHETSGAPATPHTTRKRHPKPPALPPAALSEADAATYLGRSRASLKKWRRFGTGPAFIRLGRAIGYRVRDLDDFLLRHVVRPAEG